MIAIIDYDAGNLKSVEKAFLALGEECVVTRDHDSIRRADRVVLPGVGSFGTAMQQLKKYELDQVIREVVQEDKPFLGICLGMQALFAESEEGAGVKGLGLIPGTVRRLPDCGLKIPHMGWNSLTPAKPSPLFKGLPEEPYVYFVHSYACKAADPADVLAVTDYGVPFHAAVQRGRILGFQFHPEKSGDVGQKLLANFVEMVRGTA